MGRVRSGYSPHRVWTLAGRAMGKHHLTRLWYTSSCDSPRYPSGEREPLHTGRHLVPPCLACPRADCRKYLTRATRGFHLRRFARIVGIAIGGWCVVTVVLVAAIGIIGAFVGGSEPAGEAAGIPAGVEEPASTSNSPTATPTPRPTATATARPTATPSSLNPPTATPRPTPPVVRCPSSVERTYFNKVSEISSTIAQSMRDFSTLLSLASDNPLLITDDEWRTQMVLVLVLLQTSAKEIRDVTPVPSSVRHIHLDMERIADLIDRGTNAFARGVDSGNVDLIYTGANSIDQMTAIASSVTSKVSTFCR